MSALALQSSSSTTSDVASVLTGRAEMTIDAASGLNNLQGFSFANGNCAEADSKLASTAEQTVADQLEIKDFIRTAPAADDGTWRMQADAASSSSTSDPLELAALPPSPGPAAFIADDGDISSFPLLSPEQRYRPFAASKAIDDVDVDNINNDSLYFLEF
eukprot:g81908.t1